MKTAIGIAAVLLIIMVVAILVTSGEIGGFVDSIYNPGTDEKGGKDDADGE